MWLIFRSNCLAVTRSSATLPRFCVIKLISFIGIDLAPLSLQLWRLPALHPGIFCHSLLETLFERTVILVQSFKALKKNMHVDAASFETSVIRGQSKINEINPRI